MTIQCKELLTDIAVAQACEVELQGGSGEGGCCHHLLEVRPAGIACASDATCKACDGLNQRPGTAHKPQRA